MALASTEFKTDNANLQIPRNIEIFKAFQPYDQLLLECSDVLKDLCTSVWLFKLPVYDHRPNKTILKFRAKQKTQEIPFVTLAAFRHHIENITRIGKLVFNLRRIDTWIEKVQLEVDKLPSIFQWTGGILKLASNITVHENDIRTCERTLEKLGALIYRLSAKEVEHQDSFSVRALVNVEQIEMNCQLEANRRYTVENHNNPYLWKLKETNQFIPSIFLEAPISKTERELGERTQHHLLAFKAHCISKLRNELLTIFGQMEDTQKRQSEFGDRKPPIYQNQMHFPRRGISFHGSPSCQNTEDIIHAIPAHVKMDLLSWLREKKSTVLPLDTLNGFKIWFHSQTGYLSASVKDINQGLTFIHMLQNTEYDGSADDYEESGFTEIEDTLPTVDHNSLINRSFSWRANIEMVTDVNKRYEWAGNVHKYISAQKIGREPKEQPVSDSVAVAKQFVWELTNRTAATKNHVHSVQGHPHEDNVDKK